jgi:hypothetical protein
VGVNAAATLAAVDAALAQAKGPLVMIRRQHGVRGDVTFLLEYDASGTVDRVTVEFAPADMPPAFAVAACIAIKRTVQFPATGGAGTMSFLDLGLDSPAQAAAVNGSADYVRRQRLHAGTPAWVVALWVLAGLWALVEINYFWRELSRLLGG